MFLYVLYMQEMCALKFVHKRFKLMEQRRSHYCYKEEMDEWIFVWSPCEA